MANYILGILIAYTQVASVKQPQSLSVTRFPQTQEKESLDQSAKTIGLSLTEIRLTKYGLLRAKTLFVIPTSMVLRKSWFKLL
mgnify:CR=1 FL=1